MSVRAWRGVTVRDVDGNEREQKPRSGSDVFVMWGLVGLVLIVATLTILPFLPAIIWGAVLAIARYLAGSGSASSHGLCRRRAANWRQRCPLPFLSCFLFRHSRLAGTLMPLSGFIAGPSDQEAANTGAII